MSESLAHRRHVKPEILISTRAHMCIQVFQEVPYSLRNFTRSTACFLCFCTPWLLSMDECTTESGGRGRTLKAALHTERTLVCNKNTAKRHKRGWRIRSRIRSDRNFKATRTSRKNNETEQRRGACIQWGRRERPRTGNSVMMMMMGTPFLWLLIR